MTERFDALIELARTRDGKLHAADDAQAREALVQAVAREPSRRAWNRPQLMLAAAAAAMAVMVLLLAWPDATLSYTVAGASADDGYVHAATEPARITFSDGTSFELAGGSAARVVDINADGARVLLERGALTAHVQPRRAAQWTVAAGPYSVLVTGTAFEVSWEPDAQRFFVDLTEGSVMVTGPMATPGLAMRAGQRLLADVDQHDLQLTQASATSATPDISAAAPTSVASSPSASAASPSASVAPPVEPAPAAVAWSTLIAQGKYAEVMGLARGIGIGSVLSGGTMDQLVALGDAARYTGDGATSQQVLVSLRERFPSSSAAKTAAFLLGRMAEGGSVSAALTWYDRYLAESPSGTYASEALGRKMVLLSRSQPAQARAIAQQYLRLYPKGGYAHVAQQLTQP